MQAWSLEQAFPDFASPSEKATLNRITDQVNSGNYSALYDAAKLPAPVAIQYLYLWTAPANSSPQVQVVGQALKQVAGYADYLRQDMASITAQGGVPVGDFEIVELIDTPEAAAVIAPYLFDFKTTTPQDGDLMGDSNLFEALDTLTQMKLPGAPPPQSPQMSHSAYLMEWQRWAISKGFVPKGWSVRVGSPAWLIGMDEVERGAPTSVSNSSPQRVVSATPSSLIEASSPGPSSTSVPVANPPPTKTPPTGPSFGILVGVVLALVIIGGIFARKRNE